MGDQQPLLHGDTFFLDNFALRQVNSVCDPHAAMHLQRPHLLVCPVYPASQKIRLELLHKRSHVAATASCIPPK
jgi:hypothetical protein